MALTQREKLERKAVRREQRAVEKARQAALRQEARKELRAWLNAQEKVRRAAMTPAERDAEDAEEAEAWREIHELMRRAEPLSHAERVLGIKHGDDPKAAYRALAKKHHPDVGGNAAKMVEINAAYEVLTAQQ
jgi:hypothetical protein